VPKPVNSVINDEIELHKKANNDSCVYLEATPVLCSLHDEILVLRLKKEDGTDIMFERRTVYDLHIANPGSTPSALSKSFLFLWPRARVETLGVGRDPAPKFSHPPPKGSSKLL